LTVLPASIVMCLADPVYQYTQPAHTFAASSVWCR